MFKIGRMRGTGLLRLLLLLGFVSYTTPASCSGQVSQTTTSCSASQITPDCTWINANKADICTYLMPSWEIVNGLSCSLQGASYGCVFQDFVDSTDSLFCCAAAAAASASPLATVSSSPRASRSKSVAETTSASARVSRSVSVSSTYSPSQTTTTTLSVSPLPSRSAAKSSSLSGSAAVSVSRVGSFTATATVFYTGLWVPYVRMNYAGADIAMIGSYTLNQCKLQCWLNPSCGLIVANTPCSTMNLTSTDPDTVVCSECWLKLTSGWSILADTASSSFMLYDRVYPPTRTGAKSVSTTASPRATATVATGGTYDICALNGGSVSLPFIGSSVTIKTNTATQYTNGLNCAFTVRGATVGSTLFVVTPTFLSTAALRFGAMLSRPSAPLQGR